MTDYMEKFKLNNKTAMVCGGNGLIGKQLTIALAQAGAKVVVLDINEQQAEQLLTDCKEKNLNVSFEHFDCTKLEKYSENISKLREKHGPVHIFINTAYPRTSDWGNKLEDIPTESWQKNTDMHMNSYCILTKEFAELMKKDGVAGSIINIGSIYGVLSPDFEVYSGTTMTSPAAYSAIKGGIINFSRYCASYYGKDGIRINIVCPGGVFDNQNETFVKNYNKRTLLKRMANADEIACPVLFLASDASSYITGFNLMVDGGWTAI